MSEVERLQSEQKKPELMIMRSTEDIVTEFLFLHPHLCHSSQHSC